ncbi:DUF4124 domain-containing protein [Lysobacter korlensis]|uniref:DUF4124 domain-containing protein n=1 Tax=Lysobacter korlensis TaxID=553636 RepID=A0ABV6RHY8_9GAMM
MNLKRVAGLLLALTASGGAAAAELVIYRCTDANGRLTLRDTPCRKGEQQQARTMQRPTDPPARPAAPAASAPPAAPAERTRIVVVTPPRPLYQCVTPDGEHYTSENDAGQPRWVPLWTLGYPLGHGDGYRPYVHGGVQARVGGRIGRDGRYDVRIGDGGHHHHPVPPLQIAYPAGAWVRDACHPLPPQEVCARLSDRRYELDRRYHSALQSERVRITTEQRGIDARLATDCGAN